MKLKRLHFLSIILSGFMISCDLEDLIPLNNLPTGKILPKVYLTIEDRYLWNEDSGLYVTGVNGSELFGITANYNQKWEHPAHVSYTYQDEILFEDQIGFRIKGNYSRRFPNKSFGLYWRKEYGDKDLDFDVFPQSKANKYKRLRFRNGGTDPSKVMIKDAFTSRIVQGLGTIEVAATQPISVFLNDEYWGLYNLRESITPHHFEYKYGVDSDNVDILETHPLDPAIDDGTDVEYLKTVNYINSHDLSKDEEIEQLWESFDKQSFIDYFVVQTYIANTDWPFSNMKWWRESTSETHKKWQWIITDSDRGFESELVDFLWLGSFYEDERRNEKLTKGFAIFDKVMTNKNFRKAFFERYLFILDHFFEQERLVEIIEELELEIGDNFQDHYKRWNRDYPRQKEWHKRLDKMKEFNVRRQRWLRPKIEQWLEEIE